jgi:small subunit ribosomal protein S20
MNKKQRNKKSVKQTLRNRIINKRYTSTIKTLSKLFTLKNNECKKNIESDKPNDKEKNKIEISKILKSLYSIIDKAVKKGVIHKNTAARKKSRVGKIYFKIQS